MGDIKQKEEGEYGPDDDRRKLELSLVLDFGAEDYRGADGEVNEDLMCREALNYVAEAAEQDEFEIEISRVSEDDP